MVLVAPPGTGKSNICEAIASGGANPECDSLGFKINSDKTALIDTERVLNDLYRGLLRVEKRTEMSRDKLEEKVHLYSFVLIDSVEDMRKFFKKIISENEYELIIIDGSADFVKSVNDEEESKSFWRWLISLANKHGFGVIVTIHPNPNDKEGKATGHLGSQAQKKAEAVFNVFQAKDDKQVRIITTEAGSGKVRNAKDQLTTSFKWGTKEGMFISCNVPMQSVVNKDMNYFFKMRDSYTHKELCEAIIKSTIDSKKPEGCDRRTAERRIKDSVDKEMIVLRAGVYVWKDWHQQEEAEQLEIYETGQEIDKANAGSIFAPAEDLDAPF